MPHPLFNHIFQQTGTIFNQLQYIIRTNVLINFQKEHTINVTPRGLTSHMRKTALPPGSHVFQLTRNIFRKYIWDTCSTNKNAPSPSNHVFRQTKTTLELFKNIIKSNDWKINFTSRVLTRKTHGTHPGSHDFNQPISF
ncbi:hypothetical protein DPMN_124786 [Dreissena polymorpha]|uniref:Uncharacterized protein n=1 Tax=Dreissena polymorpha TaxID=45954 RepID=A0A9D4H054_DREPO|nr:hypothetical protein DPMN_124786 [Dreissena polymorpha]